MNRSNIDIYSASFYAYNKEVLQINVLDTFEPDWNSLNLLSFGSIKERKANAVKIILANPVKPVISGRFLRKKLFLKYTILLFTNILLFYLFLLANYLVFIIITYSFLC